MVNLNGIEVKALKKLEENGVDAYYKSMAELFDAASKEVLLRVAVYFPLTEHFEEGCVYAVEGSEKMDFNRYYTDGFTLGMVEEKYFNGIMYFLKNLPMTFQDAVFWKNEKVIFLNLKKATIEPVYVWHYIRGCINGFTVKTEDGNEEFWPAYEYEKSYVFLKP